MEKNQYNESLEKIGYWEIFYPNGKLHSKGNFINDSKDGYWEGYFTNGNLSSKGCYRYGLQNGYWEDYASDGQINFRGCFVEGYLDGYWEYQVINNVATHECFYLERINSELS